MALVRIGGSAELQLPSARIYAALCSSNLPLCKQILTDLLRSIIDLFLCFNPLKITNKLNRIRHQLAANGGETGECLSRDFRSILRLHCDSENGTVFFYYPERTPVTERLLAPGAWRDGQLPDCIQ